MLNTIYLRDWYLLESRQFYFQIVVSHFIKGHASGNSASQLFFGFKPLVWKLKLL